MSRTLKLLAPTLYMLGIIALSSIPGDNSTGETLHLGWLPPSIQNLLHIPLYGVLAYLWMIVLWDLKSGSPRWLTAAICLSFACIDELYQTTVPGRFGSMTDVILDSAGVLLIILVSRLFPTKFTNPKTLFSPN